MKASTNNHQADQWKLRGWSSGAPPIQPHYRPERPHRRDPCSCLAPFARTSAGIHRAHEPLRSGVCSLLRARSPRRASVRHSNSMASRTRCAWHSWRRLRRRRADALPRFVSSVSTRRARRGCRCRSRPTATTSTNDLAEGLRGSVHFVRVSMDGVGATYESIRRRSFPDLLARLKLCDPSPASASTSWSTITRCPTSMKRRVAARARSLRAAAPPPDARTPRARRPPRHVAGPSSVGRGVQGPLKLCINEAKREGFPTCDPSGRTRSSRVCAHRRGRRAQAVLVHATGVPLGDERRAAGARPTRSRPRGERHMKIWYQHGSEHSANLVMIGHFENATEATRPKRSSTRSRSRSRRTRTRARSSSAVPRSDTATEMLDLLGRLNIGSIGPRELEQFAYEVNVKARGKQDLSSRRRNIDISAFLKVMFHQRCAHRGLLGSRPPRHGARPRGR